MSDDLYDVRGEQERETAAREKARLAEIGEVNDWKWLMAHARGRRLVWRLLERTGIYRSSMTGNSFTFFKEGERNVGLFIQATLVEHCPEDYAKMLTEQKDYVK